MGWRSSTPRAAAARSAGVQIRPGHGDDALRRQALAHPLLDEGDGVVAGLPVERGVPPDRFPAGEPAWWW